jgi:hypothetical protein
MKQLDELDLKREKDAEFTGDTFTSRFSGDFFLPHDTEKKDPIDKATLRWSHFREMKAELMLPHVQQKVFPFIKELNGDGTAFTRHKCPYCGCGDIKGVHHSRREAYDHFLPKGTYPFNSVNFHNLAPMCHECNSTYKLAKDPTRHLDPISRKTGGTRRKAFYSYAAVASGIAINLTLKTKDITRLQPDEIDLQVTAPGREEEVEAWKDVFGIEERYKAKLCGKNDGIAWLQHIVEEAANGELTGGQLLLLAFRAADRSPYDGANFLKKPFLRACQIARIICPEQPIG